MIRKDIIDYRCLYDQSVYMLQCNILKDIAVLLATSGLVKFEKAEQFSFGKKTVTGVLLQQNGMFILTSRKMFEVSEGDKTFVEFTQNPYNLICLYEKVVKKLGFKIED